MPALKMDSDPRVHARVAPLPGDGMADAGGGQATGDGTSVAPDPGLACRPVSRAARLALAATGILFVGIGAVGAALPGIPTVGPLLVASYCFARSFPALEKRLIRNRLFARFLVYLDDPRKLPMRARVTGLGMMWCSIGISLATLRGTGGLNNWTLVGIVSAGLVGTWFICRGILNRAVNDVTAGPSGAGGPHRTQVGRQRTPAP